MKKNFFLKVIMVFCVVFISVMTAPTHSVRAEEDEDLPEEYTGKAHLDGGWTMDWVLYHGNVREYYWHPFDLLVELRYKGEEESASYGDYADHAPWLDFLDLCDGFGINSITIRAYSAYDLDDPIFTEYKDFKVFRLAGIRSIGKNYFADYSSLCTVTGVDTSQHWREWISGDKKPKYDGCLEYIGAGAFRNCKNLQSISFISNAVNLQSIGSNAFEGCPNIYAPCSSDSAFYDYAIDNGINISLTDYEFDQTDDGLQVKSYSGKRKDIVIPPSVNGKSVTGIKKDTFKGRTDITSVALPDSVTSIGESAFEGCYLLESVRLPKNLVSIGQMAFKDCFCIETVYAFNRLTDVGIGAFAYCESISNVYFGGTKDEWEKINFKGGNTRVKNADVNYSYQESDPSELKGWQKISGKWYYYKDGQKVKGWLKKGGKWFYLDALGGEMREGWTKTGGVYYYLKPSTGVLCINKWVNNDGYWYHTDREGARITCKWYKIDGFWYYIKSNGRMAVNERVVIDDIEYSFDKDGKAQCVEDGKYVYCG